MVSGDGGVKRTAGRRPLASTGPITDRSNHRPAHSSVGPFVGWPIRVIGPAPSEADEGFLGFSKRWGSVLGELSLLLRSYMA